MYITSCLDTEAETVLFRTLSVLFTLVSTCCKRVDQPCHFGIYRPSFRSVRHDGQNKTIEKSEFSCDAECFGSPNSFQSPEHDPRQATSSLLLAGE